LIRPLRHLLVALFVCSVTIDCALSRTAADYSPGETVFVKGLLGAIAASRGVVVRTDASKDTVLVKLVETGEMQWYRPSEVVNRLDRNSEATDQVVRGANVLASVVAATQVVPMNSSCRKTFEESHFYGQFGQRRTSRLCSCMAQRAYAQLNIEEWAHLKRNFARGIQSIQPERWATVQEPCAVDIEEATELLDSLWGSRGGPFITPAPPGGTSSPTVTVAVRNDCASPVSVTLRMGQHTFQTYLPPKTSSPARTTMGRHETPAASLHFRLLSTKDAVAPAYNDTYSTRPDRWSEPLFRPIDLQRSLDGETLVSTAC
jgi:hypothetical protein